MWCTTQKVCTLFFYLQKVKKYVQERLDFDTGDQLWIFLLLIALTVIINMISKIALYFDSYCGCKVVVYL